MLEPLQHTEALDEPQLFQLRLLDHVSAPHCALAPGPCLAQAWQQRKEKKPKQNHGEDCELKQIRDPVAPTYDRPA
jgi:hypothetical protein